MEWKREWSSDRCFLQMIESVIPINKMCKIIDYDWNVCSIDVFNNKKFQNGEWMLFWPWIGCAFTCHPINDHWSNNKLIALTEILHATVQTQTHTHIILLSASGWCAGVCVCFSFLFVGFLYVFFCFCFIKLCNK